MRSSRAAHAPARRSLALLALPLIAIAGPAFAEGPILPAPYTSFSDSPFASTAFSWFHLEDFEDGLTATGLSMSAGSLLTPGPETDSVDGDDGVIDGLGQAGHSWYLGASEVTIRFDSATLGALPTSVGLAWTDVGTTTGTLGVGRFQFEVFDLAGHSVGLIDSLTFGDGDFHGQTAEDRFIGFERAAGIAWITFRSLDSSDWELDHVQYGLVPAPGVPALLLLAAAPLARRRGTRA